LLKLNELSSSFINGNFGSDNGLIYKCDETSCKQLISSSYLNTNDNTYLYNCNNNGYCTVATDISIGYYLNGMSLLDNSKPLIKCTDTNINSCSIIDAIEGYTIDAGNNNKSLIKCENNYCRIIENDATYYKSKTFIDNYDKTKLIYCSYELCEYITASTKPAHVYLDGSKSESTYIITCTNEGCTSIDYSNLLEQSNLHFIDGAKPANIITCEKNTGCQSIIGNKFKGLAYIDGTDKSKIIKCEQCINNTCNENDICVSEKGNTFENYSYIDGSDENLKSIIQCTTDNGCVSTDQSNNLEFSELYYINGIDPSYIIHCSIKECSLEKGNFYKYNTIYLLQK